MVYTCIHREYILSAYVCVGMWVWSWNSLQLVQDHTVTSQSSWALEVLFGFRGGAWGGQVSWELRCCHWKTRTLQCWKQMNYESRRGLLATQGYLSKCEATRGRSSLMLTGNSFFTWRGTKASARFNSQSTSVSVRRETVASVTSASHWEGELVSEAEGEVSYMLCTAKAQINLSTILQTTSSTRTVLQTRMCWTSWCLPCDFDLLPVVTERLAFLDYTPIYKHRIKSDAISNMREKY